DVSGSAYVVGSGEELRIGGFLRDNAEDKAAEEALAHAYLHDALTGLPNRTLFTYRLAYALAKGKSAPGSVAVLVLDLDRFKAINDGVGHEVGDEVLVAVAARLQHADGSAEVIARLGGDEFLVLFDGDDAEKQALAFSHRVLHALRVPISAGDGEVFITASIGIACTTARVTEATPLLSNADAAMYQAKKRGGRTVEVFGEAMRMRVLERMNTEHSLHRALERSELRLFYQPVVDIGGSRAVGVEALLRWEHPEQGLVAPNRFIPVAEESGLIIPIGAWVLHEACTQLSVWRTGRHGAPRGAVEVNLSARQIDHPDIVSTVERILEDTGLPPDNLTLEITESALMNDAVSALRVLRALKALGVMLAIDDFGTGYSSLSHLQRFPLDILKIDKSFVDELGADRGGPEIVAAVIKLAHALDLQVIAEGVETERQLEVLRRLDCDLAQGYLFSRPVPADELVGKFPLRLGA
ncbi:MAG: EAL domain-containing protein, partial [Acidimicrobiales bacterium]